MGDRMGARVRTAAGAYRILAPASRRTDRSCEGRRGGARDEPRSGQGAPAPGGTRQGPKREAAEIWSQQDRRGLTARELIRLAQAVRLRAPAPRDPSAGR